MGNYCLKVEDFGKDKLVYNFQGKKRKLDILTYVNNRPLMLILLMRFKSSNFQYSQVSIVYRINKT